MEKVTVEHVGGHAGKQVGDHEQVSVEDARRLVKSGVAVYAKVADAKTAGADPADAATKR